MLKRMMMKTPTGRLLFLKTDSAILPKRNPFYIPNFTKEVHYELEVLVKINKVGKHIDKEFSNNYYSEIGIGIDFTARDLQQECKSKGLPWEKAKAFDNSAVIGKKFIPKSMFEKMDNIPFYLLKNKVKVQDGNTKDRLFSIDKIISYVSQFMTLKIGDIIF